MCNGQGVPLGQLGDLVWFRCRQCGMDFSKKRKRKAGREKDRRSNSGSVLEQGESPRALLDVDRNALNVAPKADT